jgi:hypothetical protein
MRAEYQQRFCEPLYGIHPSENINGYMKKYMQDYRALKKKEKAEEK